MENSEETQDVKKPSQTYLLTPEIVKPLKCSFCKLYLSYCPIFMTTQDDVKYKCGRCSIKTRFNFRDLMYEDLAKHMLFPCIYKDCPDTLAWDDVRNHEKDCKYRTIPCIASDCQEAVLIDQFGNHFKESHKSLFHSEKIVLDKLHSSGGIAVLEKDGNVYVLLYDTNLDKYRMSLCGLKTTEKQFEVAFKSKDSKISIVLAENNLIYYNDRVHCYKCLKGDCKLEYHIYCHYRKGLLKYANAKIEKVILKRTFDSEMTCTVSVVDEKVETENDDGLEGFLTGKDVVIDEVTEDDETETEKHPEPVKTDALKELLQCPGCKQQLSEPIFQCLGGHGVCKDCKTNAEDSKCSSCDSKLENTRNYIIEEAITNLKLKEEPSDAQEKEITCPMSKCHESIKLSAISNHFKESHIENFHFNKVTLKNVYGYYNVDVLVKNGKTYLLFFDFDDYNFGIGVCSIDDDDEVYEVKLFSENKKYALIADDQKIVKFNDKEHCFKCSISTCKNVEHIFRLKRKEIFRRLSTKINRESIKRAFMTSFLIFQINIKETKENKTDRIIKQLFECPICKDYMVPPIYQCVAGHTLCNVCKSKVEKCPSCEGSIEETRNFLLESIAEVVELPCNYESKSCTFRGGVKRVATHELECPLNTKKLCTDSTVENETNKDTTGEDMETAPITAEN